MKYEWEDSVAEAMYDIKEMLPEGITLIGLAVMHDDLVEAALVEDENISDYLDVVAEQDVRSDILGDANARHKEASDRSRVHFENIRVKAQKEKMQ